MMKNTANMLFNNLFIAIVTCVMLVSCGKDDTPEETQKSMAKAITSFSFLANDNTVLTIDVNATVNESSKSISADFPSGTAIDALVPTIEISEKATVSPSTKSAQDFSNFVDYTVTAEDGSKTTYSVTVTVAPPDPVACNQAARTDSGPITVTENNQVVKDLHITTTDANGILINGFSGVTISNCLIEYTGANMGIRFSNADNLTIENCSIIYTDAPAAGPLPDAQRNCIDGFNSQGLVVTNVRVEDGSTGIRMNQCDNSELTFIEGYNMRGPFPRGQLVQYDKCDGGLLENFSVINDREIAWTEDNISVFKSGGQQIKKGLIIGNNSPSGVGILFEDQNDSEARGGFGGLVEDIDLIEMGNGAVSSVDGSGDVIFRRVRVKDNICGDLGQDRGEALSNSLVFSGFGTEAGLGGNEIIECAVFNLCNPSNVIFPNDRFTTIDFTNDVDFEPRDAISLEFCEPN